MSAPAGIGNAVKLLVTRRANMWEAAQRSSHERWLSDSERQRLAQLQRTSRREEFIACRYALRLLLAGGAEGIEEWSLDAPAGQAPCLGACHVSGDGEATTSIHLSLSHSQDWIACAMTAQPVGVDIEIVDPNSARSVDELAQIACTDAEREQLRGIPKAHHRQTRFMQFWSAKEAWFKQQGSGIDLAMLTHMDAKADGVCASRESPSVRVAHWTALAHDGSCVLLSVCVHSSVGEFNLIDHACLGWSRVLSFQAVQ